MKHPKHSNPEVKVVAGTGGKKRMSMRMYTIAICLLVMVFVVVGVLVSQKKPKNKDITLVQQTTICQPDLIARASPNLPFSKSAELNAIADEIRKLPDNQKDANCQYILLVSYLNNAKPAEARTTMETLFQIENFEQALDPTLKSPGSPSHNRAAIQESVRVAEERRTESQNNALELDRSE